MDNFVEAEVLPLVCCVVCVVKSINILLWKLERRNGESEYAGFTVSKFSFLLVYHRFKLVEI